MRVLVRADAHPAIGAGHVMRGLALAQGLLDADHEVTFATYCTNQGALDRLRAEPLRLVPIEDPSNHDATFAEADEADVVVLDGYELGSGLQHAFRTQNKVLVVDDYAHLDEYEADVVLNQNPGADGQRYRTNPEARLLMGPEYVLLRREFRQADRSARTYPPEAAQVLVTLGGADPGNHTLAVKAAVDAVPGAQARIVTGDATDMPALMAWADIAVSAGGTTMLELAYMGVPTLAGIVADNQEPGVSALAEAGVVRSLGWLRDASAEAIAAGVSTLLADAEAREAMGRSATALVDGRGVERVIAALES